VGPDGRDRLTVDFTHPSDDRSDEPRDDCGFGYEGSERRGKMRRHAVLGGLVLIALGVVLGATVFRADIAQATGLAQSVTVDNTPAQAVPVREQNLDSGNIKVHEQGTASVRNVDNPARQPVMLNDRRIFPNASSSFVDDLYTVPANKALVIEYVHAQLFLPTDDQGSCSLVVQQQQFVLDLPVVHTESLNQIFSPPERWDADLPVRLYFNAGDHIQVTCVDGLSSGVRNASLIISGHLVNIG
jgi:hypothetical protein